MNIISSFWTIFHQRVEGSEEWAFILLLVLISISWTHTSFNPTPSSFISAPSSFSSWKIGSHSLFSPAPSSFSPGKIGSHSSFSPGKIKIHSSFSTGKIKSHSWLISGVRLLKIKNHRAIFWFRFWKSSLTISLIQFPPRAVKFHFWFNPLLVFWSFCRS